MGKGSGGHTEEGRARLRASAIKATEARLEAYYPVDPLRAAYLERREAYGLTLNEVALRMNWIVKNGTKKGQAEGGRVSRALGMRPEMGRSARYGHARKSMNPELAMKLADAIGVPWWEVWPDA